jgi:hypothetical protein
MTGGGFGDWGDDALLDAGDGFLKHEILLSKGATLWTEFRAVSVESAAAREASE